MRRVRLCLMLGSLLSLGGVIAWSQETTPPAQGTMPMSSEPDTYQRPSERIFPLWKDKLVKDPNRELPPPFGIMAITNWMDSDWKFESAAVSLANSPYINLDAAANATMDLQIQTTGVKADLWVLPFLDLMVGMGKVDADAQLGLRDIPIHYDAAIGGGQTIRGDAIIPMKFDGTYYSFGTVLAGAYRRLYAAADTSWVKTNLSGSVDLGTEGFWTFTASPKIGYNAGLSQVYVGGRYISKNEHYFGTVPLASGQTIGFDVHVKTASWVPNFGIRSVIRKHWEVLMESAIGQRYQITAGVGYRW